MYAPALIVSLPLLAGVAGAILGFHGLPDSAALSAVGAALLLWLAAAASFALDERAESTTLIVVAALAVGLSLGASDSRRVYRSSLSEWFDRAAPDSPVSVSGVLREDALPTGSGVALSIDVSGVGAAGGSADADHPVEGGVRLSIGGALLTDRVT